MKLQGLALWDYYTKNNPENAISIREDGKQWVIPVHTFFRDPQDFNVLEQTAVKLCSGRTIDIGAGAGSLSMALQKAGIEVTAIDNSEYASEIMRLRGIKNVCCSDIYDYSTNKKFDTVLIMMNGIGIAETLNKLSSFLICIRNLLSPGGQALFDSTDITKSVEDEDIAYHEFLRSNGRYTGDYRFNLKYKGETSEMFRWLFLDEETLYYTADKNGFIPQIIYQDEDYRYLARMVLK